ncbi:MAG: hydroxymethylglutaryl-CoA lyase [Bdellovibrionaceae bacterium]|nr:hydroxymethylglutaryl-CoA lyase [Pseudobdellovibrionaceae bacterium]
MKFLEVSPRDGLQNEKKILSLEDKTALIIKLAQTGLKRIELGSFVSPKWIPQMKDSKELVQKILKLQNEKQINSQIEFSVLIPNQKGLNFALSSGIKEISIFLSSTDSFSKKNINTCRQESYKKYQNICKKAHKENLKIRAYLSVCFDCPYEGKVPQKEVIKWVQKIQELGVYEISISDTTGKARAEEIESLFEQLFVYVPKEKLACHFHNVHGTALTNVWSAYKMGVMSFDGSVGGLGGCPYSKVPSGNIPTESLIYLLKGAEDPMIKKLLSIGSWLEKKLEKKLSSPLLNSPYYNS